MKWVKKCCIDQNFMVCKSYKGTTLTCVKGAHSEVLCHAQYVKVNDTHMLFVSQIISQGWLPPSKVIHLNLGH